MISTRHAVYIVVFTAMILIAIVLPNSFGATGPLDTPVVDKDVTSGIPEKFDDQFYEKVQDLELPYFGHGLRSSTIAGYYDIVIVVARYDALGNDIAEEQKNLVVKKLKKAGAVNIRAAESLIYVTASVPITQILDFSLHDEVYAIGDGRLEVFSTIETARQTINVTPDDIMNNISKTVPDGSGVKVAVLELGGIGHPMLQDQVLESFLCTGSGCVNVDALENTLHASIVATTIGLNHTTSPGIAKGVQFLSMDVESNIGMYHALDKALEEGARVANLSIVFGLYCTGDVLTYNLIMNDVVTSGLFVSASVGNDGNIDTKRYQSIRTPSCANNVVSVGGINDRQAIVSMFPNSGKGPSQAYGGPVLKPEIVAPAVNIVLPPLNLAPSGTSMSTPIVSGAAAILIGEDPSATPVMVKAGLLLGANWTGPVPCTSFQYEQNNTSDGCSYARQPNNATEANTSIDILNNVGFGILDVGKSLEYTRGGDHIISGNITENESHWYTFSTDGTEEIAKTILTWNVDFPFYLSSIGNSTYYNYSTFYYNLDLEVHCTGQETLNARSAVQTSEFAVFEPLHAGLCNVLVHGTDLDGRDAVPYVLASTHQLTKNNSVPPTIDSITGDTSINEGQSGTLTGMASDTDGSIASYQWTVNNTSAVTVTSGNTATLQYTAFQVTADTQVTFTLTVTDDDGDKASDTVVITVNNVDNRTLAANAGPDQTVALGASVALDGSGSTGTDIEYSWTQIAGGPTVTLTGDNTASPTFTAPSSATTLKFTLTVTDAASQTDTDAVTITIPATPSANAGHDQTVALGASVALDGSGSTGTDIEYSWTQTAGGPTVTLTGDNTASPTFTAPSSATTLKFTLTVTDAASQTDTDAVTITIQATPSANAGPDQTPNSVVEINDSTANGPALSDTDYFGTSVTPIGDLDGDGVTDLAVGAYGDDDGGLNRGAVHIMFMNTDGTVDSTVEINSSTANGPTLSDDDQFGVSVASIGDLDGDGVTDLAVGAYGDDDGGLNRGAVHIMFMNTDGTVDSTVEINSSTANGPTLSDDDQFGVSVASIGDLDGDGVTDLAVGAYGDDDGGLNRGAVHIMFMNTDGTVDSTVEINSSTANGPTLSNFDYFGVSVASIGDLDGDGVTDLAVGAYLDDDGGSDRGAVHIMFMNTDGTVDSTVEINSSTANGPTLSDDDQFGVSVASIGDLDGDGVTDLAVGAYLDDDGGSDRGAVHIMFMNTDGTVDSTVEINSSTANGPTLSNNDYFGVSVASIGDLDGDGVTDLAVGAYLDDDGGSDRGAVHIIFINDMRTAGNGSVDSTVEINSSTANGPTLSNNDYFGTSVAAIGDLDGDGVTDLAVGAYQDGDGGSNRGAVHIMFMNTDGTVDSTVEINSSTANGPTLSNFDYFGVSVASIGDLDGDGVTDLAVGAYLDDDGGSDRGAVHIMFMNTDGTVDSTVEINDSTTNGPALSDDDLFGASVASIGDLDGDGVTDLAVGAYLDDDGGSYRGAVHIMFMNADGTVDSTVEINDFTTNGPALSNNDSFGFSVASIGDLDGDGVTDLAVGAYQDGDGGPNRGAVHIMFMNTDGTVDSTVEINSSTTNGPALSNNDSFGFSVASIGDLDGDGVTDLAVGAYQDDDGGSDRGAVHIMFMNTDGTVDSTVEINDSTTNGPALSDDDLFGASVASIGDLDGDGVTDLAVGAFLDDDGGPDRGAINVIYLDKEVLARAVSSTTADGTYGSGETVDITIKFSEPVTVTGIPQLALDTNPSRQANYSSGSGTDTLTFEYEVQTGDTSADLQYVSESSLMLVEGVATITALKSPSEDAVLTLPDPVVMFDFNPPDAFGSLGQNKDIEIFSNSDSDPFLTTWQTTAANHAIKIPVEVHSGKNFTINWGDGSGTTTVTTNGTQSHTYATAGSYRVTMTGDLSRINLYGSGSTPASLHSINQWGDIRWSTMNSAFSDASEMTYNATDTPDLSQVTDMSFMFYFARAFNADLSDWDTSSVTNMSNMFFNANVFDGDISTWNTSSVTNMAAMFANARAFDRDISDWNTSSVTNMSNMFNNANVFDRDISDWNTSSVTNMSRMFASANVFDGDISTWNTSSVTNMAAMFASANVFDSDISGWDVSLVATMSNMFNSADAFDQNLGPWYITPDSVDFSYTDSLNITDITPQNDVLVEHHPTYTIGTGGDSNLFEIVSDSNTLAFKAAPTSTDLHQVNVIATGDSVFGNGNNHRMIQVTVSTILTDTTAPTLSSIERSNPPTENTDSQTLVYGVTFSESVTGVDAADFVISQYSTGTGSITLTGSDNVYYVTVSATQDGTYNLDLVSSGHGITDESSNPLTDTTPTGEDHTYTVSTVPADTTAPTLTSIERSSPATENTDSQTLIYEVTFSEDVTGVTQSDFALSSDSTGTANSVTSISGSGSQYFVTVSASTDGTYNLDLISSGHGIEDAAENPLTNTSATGADETYTVSTVVADTTAPRLSSIERFNPSTATTSSQTLIYEVTFSEDVTGVTQSDFALSSDSTGTAANSVTSISGSGSQYFVTVSASTDGTYNLDLISSGHGIEDAAENPLTNTSATGADETYTVSTVVADTTAPRLSSIERFNPSTATTSSQTLIYEVTFSEDVTGVTQSDFALSSDSTGTAANSVTSISGSGSTYYVTVSASSDGTYNLDLISSGHGIEDAAENPLTNTSATGADETYTVSTVVADTTAPRLSSIERFNPSSATTSSQTLVYEVTFSEDVTGVNSADFALSSDSTGGTSTNSGTDQFTQTNSPDIDITEDDSTITDTITVADSGTVTSLSLAVDVSHTYKGDLKIDLIAPDGTTTKTVHNRSGGSADDIDQTYTPDFAGVSIAGTWTLRINDNYPTADDGTLNSWTLTINHGSSSTTNPVTSLSGSGSTYYVTVSASSDGTYNLDLISSGHGIEDAAENPLTNTSATGADETYTVSTVVADTTAPRLSSIERFNPSSATTSSQTLVYEVTFSEDVTGVNSADFALSSDSTGGTSTNSGTDQFTQTNSPDIDITEDDSTITDTITVADSGTVTSLSLAVDVSHTYKGDLKIDLIAPDGTTTKTVHNRSGGSADDIDQTYTPDFAGVSIAGTWTLRINDNYPTADDGTLNSWTLTINHGSSSTTNPVTSLSGSGSTYYVTVSASSDGTYNLDLISSGHGIEDAAENPLTNTSATGADETYTVSTVVADTTAPRLSSIERFNPSSATTSSQTLVYEVTFSEDVTGVNSADFALSSDSTGGTSTNSGTDQFTQTNSPDIDITEDDSTITDTITVADSGTVTSLSLAVDVSHTYKGDLKIDLIAPDGTTTKTVHNRSGGSADDIDQTYTPDFAGVSIAGTWTLRINDNYPTADDGTLNSWTLTINHGSSSTTNPVTSLSGSGSTYYVTVSASSDGTYNLDLISSGHGIEDAAENPLTNTSATGADETYTVSTVVADTTAPRLSSIERFNPSSATTSSQTLVYEVTFSEDVTGVDTTDFALSSDSTGGTSTNSGTDQFTQTNSPDIDITEDDSTITDTITVADSGTVTSLSLAVDVSHTYKGDLKIDLIAPDGTTTKTVHNRSGGSADDIDQTYTPDFAGVSIAGTWTLRINDNYPTADDGTLNSWTLTINHGSSSTTNPVTSLSGSGSTYYVTVSASSDGTYNLDLISSGHGIEDAAENPLTNTSATGADETYTVSTVVADTTAPRLSSIERFNPSSATTSSQTLVYEVTFSEDVTGVDTTDFALSSDSTGGTSTNSGTDQFTQTNSPDIDITEDDSTITDTITVADSGTVTSLSLAVDVSHTYKGDLKIDLIAPDGTTTKTVHNRSGGSADDIDQTYTPDFAGVSIAGTWTLRINDNYPTADDGTLNSWTLTINHGSSSTTNPVTSLSGSGSTYYVTVSASSDGTYNLDLISSGHGIEDAAENPLTNTSATGADETYTVSTVVADTTAPRLSSIERFNPSSATTSSQTLVYEVTFSEDVTGVDTTDFALSSDSTGGTSTNSGTDQFTQTNSPDIDITEDDSTITDTITVADSGTVTSLSLAVDVSHTYKGDLKIDLIAPDGTTTKTVHNRSGGSADDIDQTYTPDFAGVSIAGTWTLRINDNYPTADDGTLNSWTLTINHGSSSTTNPVTSLSGSGSTYYVTVSASSDGTYNLDLISSGHGIEDAAENPLTNTSATGADETYTVSTVVADTTAPRLSSIERFNPSSATTSSQTLVYEVTFSEDVTGVNSADFALSSDSTGGTSTNSGTDQFTQTNSPDIDITEDDSTITDTITVADSGTVTSLSLAVDVSHTYKGDLKIDLIAPDGTTTKTVHNREGGSADDIDQTYTPDFAGVSITGTWTLRINDNYPTADDGTLNSWTLTINTGSSGTSNPVTSISGSGNTYYVTVSASTDGTYNLDLISSGHGIADESSNPLTNTSATGADETYTVSTVVADTTAPRLSSIERFNPSTATTSSQTLVYEVTFSEDVTGVTQSDFALSSDSTGTAANSVTSISGSGSQYFVTVSASTDGTYNLDLISSGHGIEDAAENPLTNTSATGADETYTVSTVVADTTAPRLSSIERFNPSTATTSSQTLIYEVTFSESVTGVDSADFALSSDSTGGTGTGQFTQTRSPTLIISDHATVSDTVTVTDSGNATSVSLAVDITHTYIGDLKVDLIAPDGTTTKTVHNRSGVSADDIDQTYTPDFTGVSIAGDWILRVGDNAGGDTGTLNSWTLTIHHDGSTNTTNPVTSLSGSGSTYYVTVSATQDGTYNLDLISSGHGIADIASNPLTNTTSTNADHTYTVSTTG